MPAQLQIGFYPARDGWWCYDEWRVVLQRAQRRGQLLLLLLLFQAARKAGLFIGHDAAGRGRRRRNRRRFTSRCRQTR